MMNRPKLLISIMTICVMLFSFSIVKAESKILDPTYVSIGSVNDPNVYVDQGLEENGKTTQMCTRSSNTTIDITINQAGLYTLSLKDGNWKEKRERNGANYRTYKFTDSSGRYPRIPAIKQDDKYMLLCNPTSSNNTTVTVYLTPGTYKLQIDGAWFFGQWDSTFFTIRYRGEGDVVNDVPISYADLFMSGYSAEGAMRKSLEEGKTKNTFPPPTGIPNIPNSEYKKVRMPGDKPAVGIDALRTKNKFEEAFVSLLIAVGDFLTRVLDDIVGEEVTVSNLIFNRIKAVNANFFDERTRGSGLGGFDVHSAINNWYQFFKTFAISAYLICLLSIGVHVLLNSTASGKQKARELLTEWAKGIIILFLMPIVMRWVFKLNEGLVKWVGGPDSFVKVGSSFQSGQEWSAEEIEFRSPQYVSKYTGRVTFGSEESNKNYLKKLNEYKQNLDLMRIMRAYAGATGTLGYTLLWYVLIGQLIVFIFLYYKRYFIIAFLIAVFPVTCLFNAISIMQGKRGPQISTWFKELLTNIFTQFFHAVVYAIITSVVVSIIKDSLISPNASGAANWVIIIVSINFVPEGERIIKRIISSLGGGKTGADLRGSAEGLKGLYQNTKGNIKQIMGGFKGG